MAGIKDEDKKIKSDCDSVANDNEEANADAERKAKKNRNSHKYYVTHHEECLARAREYRIKNREKVIESDRKYRTNNRDKVRKSRCVRYWRDAERISTKRKESYRQNPEPARARAKNYYALAKTSRELAVNVCPAFRFMLELQAQKNIAYQTYKGGYYAFVQRAVKGCPALTAMDASLCPMVANAAIKQEQMLAVCTMPQVFAISNSWGGVRNQARILRKQNSK